MAKFDLKEYARAGAEARVRELSAELASIFKVFPDLRGGANGVGVKAPRGRAASAPGGRKRRKMSTAARKAVGERMRAYWAARRAEKGAKKR
jgi:hypothetical protein